MTGSLQEVYLVELYNQCKFAIQAQSAAYSALDRFGQAPTDTFGPGRRYQREVFRNLHSFVLHAGNISSLLWPPDGAGMAVERAEELRRVLELRAEGHPLARAGEAWGSGRYAERLHEWIADRDDGSVYLDHIASAAEHIADLSAERRMRSFDPSRRELILWEERMQVGQLTEAIKRLCLRIEELLADVEGVRFRHSRRGSDTARE